MRAPADTVSAETRSKIMRAVRSKDTGPELATRRLLHAMGFRFRIHRADLPGTPDIILPRFSTAILVHGCYWHRHKECKRASTPKTRRSFWEAKFKRNVERDQLAKAKLRQLGWRVCIVWECQTHDPIKLRAKLRRVLGPSF